MADPSWWQRPSRLPDRYQHLTFEEIEGAERAAEMLAQRAVLTAGPASALEEVGTLEPPSPDQVLLDMTAGPRGELVALWCDASVARIFVLTDGSEEAGWPGSRASRPVPMTITENAPDGLRTTQVRVAGVDLTYPVVGVAPDGCFSIVSGVCELREDGADPNGIVVDGRGMVLERVLLGDGVLAVQATPSGKTWVGYSDTGILGNNGWNCLRRGKDTVRTRMPIGTFGLVRFDAVYSVEWEFGRAWFEAKKPDRATIDHVYALNVVDETAWVYYHRDCSIARVLADEIRIWRTDILLAHELLISDDRCALIGGFGPEYDRIVIGRLGDTDFVGDSFGRLVLPSGADLPLTARMTSRGSTLHVVADGRWYRLVL